MSKTLVYIGEDEKKYKNACCGGCLLSPVAFLGIIVTIKMLNR